MHSLIYSLSGAVLGPEDSAVNKVNKSPFCLLVTEVIFWWGEIKVNKEIPGVIKVLCQAQQERRREAIGWLPFLMEGSRKVSLRR